MVLYWEVLSRFVSWCCGSLGDTLGYTSGVWRCRLVSGMEGYHVLFQACISVVYQVSNSILPGFRCVQAVFEGTFELGATSIAFERPPHLTFERASQV